MITVFLNLVLDPLFIYGLGPVPGYGMAGAAVDSVLTQGISALKRYISSGEEKMELK